jgi:DNA polymerase III gamma/tau subunit
MPAQISNIAATIDNKIVHEKVKASILNNIQSSLGIIPFPDTTTLGKNISYLYANGFEAKVLTNKVVSALAQSVAIDNSSDDSAIDNAVNGVWNNIFQQPL